MNALYPIEKDKPLNPKTRQSFLDAGLNPWG
jgi:hypothetical protein